MILQDVDEISSDISKQGDKAKVLGELSMVADR